MLIAQSLTRFFLQNVNEDTDDMFDRLFDRYGKVVFRRNDKKPPSAEVDDDAESLSCKLIQNYSEQGSLSGVIASW